MLDAEDIPGFRLCQTAFFDEAVNLQCQSRFQEFLPWMGKAEVGKYVPVAFFRPDAGFFSFVVMLVLTFFVETFGLGQAAADEVNILLGRSDGLL